MRAKSAALVAAVCLFGPAVGGCLVPSDRGTNDRGTNDRSANDRSADATPTPGGSAQSLEGAFSYETMDDYVKAVVPMITQWMADTWSGMRLPRVFYVPRGVAGAEDCLDGDGRLATYTSESYEYCGAGEAVYVGQDTLWTFYTRAGDAGPAVGLAHEFGHHVQQQLGLPPARTTDQMVQIENQADCLAGAWTKYTDERGWLEYPDDLEDIETLFPLIGSAEGPDRDHGTASERALAFQRGFAGGDQRGIGGCGLGG